MLVDGAIVGAIVAAQKRPSRHVAGVSVARVQ